MIVPKALRPFGLGHHGYGQYGAGRAAREVPSVSGLGGTRPGHYLIKLGIFDDTVLEKIRHSS
jgi:hypothetical protein